MNEIDVLKSHIDRRFDQLEALLGRKNSRKLTEAPTIYTGDLLHRQRVEELERLFWKIINDHRGVKERSYHQPKVLIAHAMAAFFEGVTVSVLLNQAAIRRCFRRQAPADFSFNAPVDIARDVLKDSNLIICKICEADLDHPSETLIALSPGEAQRVLKRPDTLPRAFKGWTCNERAEARRSPTGGWLDVPQDPCVARVWDGDAGIPTTGKRFESVAKLREAIEGEDDDLNTTEPTQSATSRLDFGTVEDAAPATGYRQRVQFVEEDVE